MDRIAVYGTLLSEFETQRRLGLRRRLRLLGPCVIPGYLVDCGRYPGWRPGDGRVRGELYQVLRRDALAVLDAFEDFRPGERGSEFRRVRVRLDEPGGVAWIYAYNRPVATLARVESGDWAAHWRAKAVRRGSFPLWR